MARAIPHIFSESLHVFTSSTFRLPAMWERGFHRDLLSPEPSLTTLCWIAPSPIRTLHPMPTASRYLPLPPSIVEAEAQANPLWSTLSRWAHIKLAIAPQKKSVTLLTLGTPQSWLHPRRLGGPLWAELIKSVGVTLDTHFAFDPNACDSIKRATSALNVMRALGPPGECCSYLFHLCVLNPSGQTWDDLEWSSENRDRLPSKGRGVPPQSRDWGPPLEGALRNVLTVVQYKRPLTNSPQSSYRHFSRSRPSPTQGQLCRPRTKETCEIEVTTSPPLPLSYLWGRGVLEKGTYLLARRFLSCRIIGVIVRSQAPNKVLWSFLPSVPRSHRTSLSHLCSRTVQGSVGWADDPTCHDCHAADHTVAHL